MIELRECATALERYADAVSRYSTVWELWPEPRTDWDAGIWILAAVADAHFINGDFAPMREPLMTALQCAGTTNNPFLLLRLRLGQCHYELNELDEASELAGGSLS